MNTLKEAPKIFGFDTEDDSKGYVTYINFFDGDKHIGFYEPLEAIDFLMFTLDKNIMSTCWALNAMYDVMNIFRNHMNLIQIWINGSKFIKAKIKDRPVWFYDLSCHTKYSVARIGNLLDLPKLSMQDEELETYCERDTEIVYRFVQYMERLYESLDDQLRVTLPSVALHSFQKRRDIPARPPENIVKILRHGYKGGLNECFYIGKIDGNITEYDVNSMYPFIMLGKFPDPSTYHKGRSLTKSGIMCARVHVPEMIFPILGITVNEKYIFPIGEIEGYWTTDELQYAEEMGCRILQLYGGVNFNDDQNFFSDWIRDIYKRRLDCDNDIEKYLFKCLLNSLYGKFGEKGEAVYWSGTELKRYTNRTGPHANIIWSAMITARARIYLHWMAKEKDGLLYCDTDSMIFSRGNCFEESDKIGKMKISFEGVSIDIHGCKSYRFKGFGKSEKLIQKGIPVKYAKQFFDKGHVSFEKPTRFLESLKAHLDVNIWQKIEKEERDGFTKRIVTEQGWTVPKKVCHRLEKNVIFNI